VVAAFDVFFAAFAPSVGLAGALEAVEAGALPAVEAGLGAIGMSQRVNWQWMMIAEGVSDPKQTTATHHVFIRAR